MNKELYVSTTPHETKVALVEDDQLAEIYFERENEYTLAGSIYKGRVTRVLPGMQSAFVDIGLERDAFLYVSDFLDLQDEDEDSDNGSISEDDFDPKPVKSEIIKKTSAPNSKKRHTELSSASSSSPKKQKLKQKQSVELKKEDSDIGTTESFHRYEEASPSTPGSGSDGGSEFCAESGSDDDDEEWEEVSVSGNVQWVESSRGCH